MLHVDSVDNTENFTDTGLCTCIEGFCIAEVALSALASVLCESL